MGKKQSKTITMKDILNPKNVDKEVYGAVVTTMDTGYKLMFGWNYPVSAERFYELYNNSKPKNLYEHYVLNAFCDAVQTCINTNRDTKVWYKGTVCFNSEQRNCMEFSTLNI